MESIRDICFGEFVHKLDCLHTAEGACVCVLVSVRVDCVYLALFADDCKKVLLFDAKRATAESYMYCNSTCRRKCVAGSVFMRACTVTAQVHEQIDNNAQNTLLGIKYTICL